MKKEGFTILEMMAVIAIIAILAGILIPAVTTVRKNANKVKAKALISHLVTAIESYKSDAGFYPADHISVNLASEALYIYLTNRFYDSVANEYYGPYIEPKTDWVGDSDGDGNSEFVDPWENPYEYEADTDALAATRPPFHNVYTFDIYSPGPDGVTGAGFAAGNQPDDINNWN